MTSALEAPSVRSDPGKRKAAAPKTEDAETRIYRTIFESVMNQRLTPGTKLPEAALCELFGVTRSLVRRVLQRLAHDHIVELRPNRGAIVAVPTPDEMRQIFEARRALEAAMLRLAMKRARPEDFADLREQLNAEHDAMHRFDQPSWARLASAFHLRLAALARNDILEKQLNEVVSRCSLIVALYQPWGNAACEHEEHARIVDHMEAGDAETAVRLMEEHLIVLERNIALRQEEREPSLKRKLGLG